MWGGARTAPGRPDTRVADEKLAVLTLCMSSSSGAPGGGCERPRGFGLAAGSHRAEDLGIPAGGDGGGGGARVGAAGRLAPWERVMLVPAAARWSTAALGSGALLRGDGRRVVGVWVENTVLALKMPVRACLVPLWVVRRDCVSHKDVTADPATSSVASANVSVCSTR